MLRPRIHDVVTALLAHASASSRLISNCWTKSSVRSSAGWPIAKGLESPDRPRLPDIKETKEKEPGDGRDPEVEGGLGLEQQQRRDQREHRDGPGEPSGGAPHLGLSPDQIAGEVDQHQELGELGSL